MAIHICVRNALLFTDKLFTEVKALMSLGVRLKGGAV